VQAQNATKTEMPVDAAATPAAADDLPMPIRG